MLQPFCRKAMSMGCKCESNPGSDAKRVLGINTGNHFRRIRMILTRTAAAFRWFLPGVILVIIPKCPLCLAAYVLVGSGIGLSVTSATYLRGALIFICTLSLLCIFFNRLLVKYLR